MKITYLSGNNDDATFITVSGNNYTVHDGNYREITITDGAIIGASVPSGYAGRASFNNDEICLCTRQYRAPQFYLFGLKNKKAKNPSFFQKGACSLKVIYPVNISNLNNPEDIITLQALQGIIAQNSQNQLFLYNTQDSYYVPTEKDRDEGLNTADEFWLNYITNDNNGPKFSVKPAITLEDAIREFKDYIKGYSIYRLNDSNSMNLAASYTGLTGYIPLTQEQYNEYNSLLTSLGITDTITIDGNTGNFFNKYKNDLDQNMVFELNPTTSGNMPRDYAAMNKALVCYSSSSNDMKNILEKFSSPIAVFGWNQLGESDEKVFISTVSNAGDFVVPCDWGQNLSILSSSGSAQIKANQSPMPQITYDENKKYVTFLVSDGDNLQLWLNTANDARWWGNNYRTTKDIPVGWTIPPAMYYLTPDIWNYYMQTAVKDGKGDDEFIAGPSGIGYTFGGVANNNTAFNAQLNYFNTYMQNSGISVATLYGNKDWDNTAYLEGVIDLSNIKGGFYFDMNQWPPVAKGTEVKFFNNKPIMYANAYLTDTNSVNWNNDFVAVYVLKNISGTGSGSGVFIMDDIQKAVEGMPPNFIVVSPSQMVSILSQAHQAGKI